MQRASTFAEKKIWVMNIHVVIASYLFLYTMGVFNPSQENIAASLSWGSNKSTYITIFSGLVPVGGLIGTIVTVPLIDRYGRRSTMMWNDIAYIIGTTILVMPSTVTFGIGRFLTGISAGIFMTLGPIYVTEITPEPMMGKVGPCIVIANNLGLMTAYGLGLALPIEDFENDSFNYWWLFMFLFPAGVCAYQFCYFQFFCIYDTPQYYMARGMTEKANLALGIAYTKVGMEGGLRRLNSEIKGKFGAGVQKPSLLHYFTEKRFRKMIRVGFLICTFHQLSGILAIIFYSTAIFGTLGGGLFMSRILTFITGVVNFISSCLSILFLVWFGRKTLLISGQASLAIILMLLGIFSGYVDSGTAFPAFLVIIYFFFSSYSIGATLWLYVGEVLNDQILGVSCVLNMAVGVLITFLFPSAAEGVGINNCFLFFAVMMILSSAWCAWDLVETKGKEKEDILIEMKVMDKKADAVNAENDSLQEEAENNEDEGRNNKEESLVQELNKTLGQPNE